MDIKEFEIEAYNHWTPELREGQAYYNYAHSIFGDKNMRHITGTDSDPFHNDQNIDKFLIKINELLEVL